MATIMAGILGLVAVIIRPAIDGIGKCIAEPIKDHFKYLCCFNDNVKDLEKEAPKLEDKRCEVQSSVNIAQNNAEIVVPRVQTWLNEVSEIQTKKPEIDSEITTTINGGCSIVGCRYSLSKKVKKMAGAMKELRQQSENFTTISHPPQPEAMVSINIRSTIEFDSRKHVEGEIMSSLRDEGTNVVGICGMGGVGKKIMAKTIMHRAREELGFEETVMVVVSQDVDKFRIQVDIAKSLGLTLSTEGSLSSKAHELRTRLSAGTRRSLIVIDDVWRELKLEELGIPCSNTCKVLITSRNRHILEAMDVEKLHPVQVLSETEAWELFKSKAGSYIERENVVDVARQVVNECKGLPIALVTVGVALKDKASIGYWNTALSQLKSRNPRYMPEFIESVYQPIRLSYNSLENEEQKTLFLLCCLFPEDDNIPLRTLANISMGLHMYEDISSSRDTTSFLVERLKSRFLLLEGYNEDHVKMHDVVRDVAIFIAAEEKRIKCNECTWISPNIGVGIGAHGGSSLFPNLRLLWIDRDSTDKELEIHDDFLEGKSELNVFWIKCRSLQRLPKTIGLLKNLRTLVLEWCESLESISMVGELVNLEILICRDCRKIESLPVEVGRLSRLRLLELSGCRNLKTIAPGMISNLIELEELIVEHFGGWEARNVEGKRENASLCELEHLSSLTNLKIVVRDDGLAAENFRLPPNLLIIDITVGNGEYFYSISTCEKTMRLELRRDINLEKWIHECVRNVEYMSLEGDGSKSVLDLRVAQNLKELHIRDCSTVKKLVNTPFHQLEHLRLEKLCELEEICDISNLKKLSSIRIEECGRLRNLFSLSVMESGGCFLQLEELEIRHCEMMEQVLMWNEEEENQTNIHIPLLLFPKLKFVELYSLPSLTSFIKGIESIEFPQLDEIDIWKCPLLKEFVCSGSPADHHGDDNDFMLSCDPHKVKFGKLSKLQVKIGRNLYLQTPIDSFTSLSELVVSGLNGVKSFGSIWERLWISDYDMMEQVILWKDEENQMDIHTITLFQVISWNEEENQMDTHMITLFPKLPRLTSLSKGIENIQFHVPPRMKISNCPLLMESCASEIADQNDDYRHLFCKPHHKVEFDRLKELDIIMGNDDGMRRNWCPQIPMIDLFTRLCELQVCGLHGMESLFPCSIARMMQHIKTVSISSCKEMVRVIEDDAEIETQTQTTTPILLFPNLEVLYLIGLPKLRSFCEMWS